MMKKKNYLWIFVFLFLPLLVEIFGFNYRYFYSAFDKEIPVDQIKVTDGLQEVAPFEYLMTDAADHSIEIPNINAHVRYIYVDIRAWSEAERLQPTFATFFATDEGNSLYYRLGDVESCAPYEATKYYRLHTYGNIRNLKIAVSSEITGRSNLKVEIEKIKINAIRLNVRVPFHFSWLRITILYGLIFLIWLFRPASKLYRSELDFSKPKQRIIVGTMAALCILLNSMMTILDTSKYVYGYNEYNELVMPFLQGVPYLNEQPSPELIEADNPYDTGMRESNQIPYPWDTAYYNGHYYVYFGIVPLLLFYLPVYLLTKHQLQIWMIYPLLAAFAIGLFFYWLYMICKQYFHKVSLGVYCLLSLALVLSSGLYLFMVNDSIYTLCVFLPIILALAGMVLYMKAEEKRNGGDKHAPIFCYAGGSLCMALIAGCRPHLLVILVAAVCLIHERACGREKNTLKEKIPTLIAFFLPFAVVAAGLMYYNAIRFSSVFDFGSRYNLTTDDLTHRGFYMGRLIDGLYAYLIQPLSLGTRFPYVFPVTVHSGYLGRTIREKMFGGILAVKPFFYLLLFLPIVRKDLKERKLVHFVRILLVSSLIVLCIDAQMAGILYRYQNDVAWMLAMAGVVIWLSLWNKIKSKTTQNRLIAITVMAILIGFFIEYFSAADVYIKNHDPYRYYKIAQYF